MDITNQRKAIIDGLKQSIQEFKQGISDVTSADVMGLVMLTQYYDTLKEIGANNKNSTILLPHSPGGLGGMISIRSYYLSIDFTQLLSFKQLL